MTIFSTQGYTRFFRSITALFCGLAISSLLGISAHAQSKDELFRGTWQIDTPEKGTLIMIVKSQNQASYFWGDNTDRTVYAGTWASEGETATLTWVDGSQHRIKGDSLGFAITHIDAGGREAYTTKAQQVPTEILGQWAKPPTAASEIASDRDRVKGFIGIWKIGEDETNAKYIFVESNRSAATNAGGEDGLRGSWAKQGSELHITWDSGHYSILRPNKREFIYKMVEPGLIIEDDETVMRPASRIREDKVPHTWATNYRAERKVYTGGIAFSSRKNARAFYRGDWIVKLSKNRFERIALSRFGGLSTTLDSGLEGDWRLQGQDLFMRWDDGMRKILSPIGRSFVIYEYRPGRPLDGVPTRTRAAAPADSAKLAEHLKGREQVGLQIIKLADAAGIDPAQQEAAGWGRTFSRWVWPFGEDEAALSADAMLEQEFEETGETGPWWWPFWSEKGPAEQVNETETETDALKLPEPDKAAEEITIETAVENITRSSAAEETSENNGRSVRDWVWPF
jgi:hypothetical protein